MTESARPSPSSSGRTAITPRPLPAPPTVVIDGAVTKRSPFGAKSRTRASRTGEPAGVNSRTQNSGGTSISDVSVPGRSQNFVPVPAGMSVSVHSGPSGPASTPASVPPPSPASGTTAGDAGLASSLEQPRASNGRDRTQGRTVPTVYHQGSMTRLSPAMLVLAACSTASPAARPSTVAEEEGHA